MAACLLALTLPAAAATPAASDEREAGLRQAMHVPADMALVYLDEKNQTLTLDQFLVANAGGREFTRRNDVAHRRVVFQLTPAPPRR